MQIPRTVSTQRIAIIQMLKRILLIMLLSTVEGDAAESTDRLPVNLAGIGGKTCAYWLSGQTHKSEGTGWIYGFWSGPKYLAAATEQDPSNAHNPSLGRSVWE